MVIPRSWSNIEKQRDPIQASTFAEPTATDIRFKLAVFFLLGAWLTTVYSLDHSIKHYRPRNSGFGNRVFGFIKYTPFKFLLTLPLSLVLIGYDALCAFDFSVSPLKLEPNLGVMYGFGWGSTACIMLVYEIAGFLDPNEDKELIRQRRIRGAAIDSEMGITRKPHWWSRLSHNNYNMNVHEQIARNVNELGGGQATRQNIERSIELGNMPVPKNESESELGRGESDTVRTAAKLLFPVNRHNPRGRSPGDIGGVENTQSSREMATSSNRSDSTNSESATELPPYVPQQIRSMLDV
jgi:hypothetical protein